MILESSCAVVDRLCIYFSRSQIKTGVEREIRIRPFMMVVFIMFHATWFSFFLSQVPNEEMLIPLIILYNICIAHTQNIVKKENLFHTTIYIRSWLQIYRCSQVERAILYVYLCIWLYALQHNSVCCCVLYECACIVHREPLQLSTCSSFEISFQGEKRPRPTTINGVWCNNIMIRINTSSL